MTDHGQAVLGAIMWVLIFYPTWSPRCRRIRRAQRKTKTAGARRSTGNTSRQTGPMWEQDKPFPECFEQEDDL